MCGSLGSASANQAALDLASNHLRSAGHIESVPSVILEEVPMFRTELVDDPPPAVAEMRALIEGADGVMLAAPEYAGGLSGGTKNALDWLVGSASIYQRPIAILSAGTTGGKYAIEQLARTLSWQGALTVSVLSISAPRTKTDGEGRYADAPTIGMITRWVNDLVDAISMDSQELLSRVTQVVAPFGIAADRFEHLSS